ncbi:MAG TPA: radical SAM protein [Anaeromyxobacteraceae bacterium]|nr:radical SAM protein [Anaeromyxobacteraceae bacterium]
MRVLLVRPPVPSLTIGLKHVMCCEPLELEYAAAGLAGHEVRILDLLLEGGLARVVRDFRPDVVGTSAYVTGVHEATRVCRTAKAAAPGCTTVVGGVHAAVAPEDFADPAVDCVALGDGTTQLPEIVAALEAGRPLDEVPGLALVRGDRTVRTAPRPYLPVHPDALPLPRRDLVRHLRHRYYYVFHQPLALVKTTWGCPYRCNFCVPWRITGGEVFSRSPASIAEELAGLDCEDVYIVDDIFLTRPERLAELARLLRERGVRKRYLVYGRADFIATHEPIVAEWAALGLSAVLVGLEAVTDAELRSMEKHTTVDHNRRAIEVLRRNGVDVYGSLAPSPDYGPEDWARLWRFVDETGLVYLNVSPLTPLPGTDLWEASASQLTVPRRAHALYDLSHAVLPTRMALRDYYRALIGTYARACLRPLRARRLVARPMPPLWSRRSLRLWWGALRIWLQLRGAHRHHTPEAIARALDPDRRGGRAWLP